MTTADEIGKLNKLKEEGALTEDEFQKAKTSLLAKNQSAGEKLKDTVDEVATDVNMWGMFIHLSQFCGYLVPIAGLILPIILWQIKKDESVVIDRHGKIVANWLITAFILGLISAALTPVVIGFFMLFGLAIVAVVFPIIGAIKANSGEVWAYPMSFNFFKLDEPAAPAPAVATAPPEAPATKPEEKPASDEA